MLMQSKNNMVKKENTKIKILHEWHSEIIAKLLANDFELELKKHSIKVFEIHKSKSRDYKVYKEIVYELWSSADLFSNKLDNFITLNEMFRTIETSLLTDGSYPLLLNKTK